jgi:hypothetical protein
MVPSAMLLTVSRVTAMTLMAQVGLAPSTGASGEQGEAKQSQAQPTRTGKERLGGKASDDQRTDNCNVPADLRGPKPRPDRCGDGTATRPER